MKRTIKSLALALTIISSPLLALSDNSGTAVVTPFQVPIIAYQVAMGEALSAIPNTNSLLTNPATMAFLNKPYFSATHNKWIFDTYKSYISLGFPSRYGYFAGGILYNNLGTFIPVRNNIVEETEAHVYDMSLVFGYSARVHKYLSLGLNAKIEHFDYAGYITSALAGDIGAFVPYIELGSNVFLSLGFVVQNIGSHIRFVEGASYRSQPLNFRGGLAFNFLNLSIFDINLAGEVQYPTYQDLRYSGGLEIWIKKMVALRAGYRAGGYDIDEARKTAGLGFRAGSFSLDYAYVDYGKDMMDGVHRVTVSMALLGPEKKPGPVRIVDDQWDHVLALEKRMDRFEKDITDINIKLDELKKICSKMPVKTVVTEKEIIHFPEIHFPFNSAEIPPSEFTKVADIADIIRRYYRGKKIILEGHADPAGSPEYNKKLSLARAEAVKKALVEMGIPAENLVVVGKGEEDLLTPRQGPGFSGIENRRVVVIVNGPANQ